MLAQSRRRWANIKATLVQRIVIAETVAAATKTARSLDFPVYRVLERLDSGRF